MTEKPGQYFVAGDPGAILAEIKHSNCARLFRDPLYEPPSPEQISGLIKAVGWSQRQTANIVGVASNQKGSTAVRKWTTQGGPEARAIPYAAWRLMLITAGVVDCEICDGHPGQKAGNRHV